MSHFRPSAVEGTSVDLIAVDIGNSSTKLGWFNPAALAATVPAPGPVQSFPTGHTPAAEIMDLLPTGPCRWRIASVHRAGTESLLTWLNSNRPTDDVRVLTYRELPIRVNVDLPERVGLDRLAAAVAANALRAPDRAAIVVDAGSAITVDLVGADGAFEGGVILPGFRMSAQALGGADQLPIAAFSPGEAPPAIVGKNTEAAIQSGLFWGAVGAVGDIVRRMAATLHTPPDVFVTGGDLRRLAEQLGDEAAFVPDMVLSGIALAAARG
jgi:type III pantothenate kinase